MTTKTDKKLAEWVGIKWKITERTYNHLEQDIWVYPDGTIKDEPPDFIHSPDACLEYLFPKLLSDNKLWGHFVELVRWEGLPPSRRRLNDGEMIKRLLNPMYICQTIEKIIAL